MLPSFQLQVIVAETNGYKEFSTTQTYKLYTEKDVAAIIGPSYSCESEARIAGLLNRSMISYVCCSL